MIRACMSSVAETSIIPLQDFLELGDEARINTPSTFGQNWKWRMREGMLSNELAEKMNRMTRMFGRN